MMYAHPMKKTLLSLALITIGLLLVMTQHFAHRIRLSTVYQPDVTAEIEPRTGIVVATGSGGRIEAGLALMTEGVAERMLISGTGHGVSKADIIRTIAAETEENEALFRQSVICCVDLDQAVDTIGNAKEADDWANRHHLQTLILVTADYHMPRALVLFHQHMPQRQIIPHAVATPSLQLDSKGQTQWWMTPQRVQFLMQEMLKYHASQWRSVFWA
jgi:uncharacterized SAM-binding protein YcdF (DUF218 family)